jgi:Transposase and inactivated derivatives
MPWATPNLMNKRSEFAQRALQADNFRELCREYGISPKTGYKWRERFLEEGAQGMRDQSRRPKSSPDKLGEEIVCRIVRLKQRHAKWGPQKLREVYRREYGSAPSESSFKRVLEKCGLVEKRINRRRVPSGRIADGRKAQACNEVWTVDFKGWWHDQDGRCEPLTVRDEYSRFLLEMRALPNARTGTVQTCFEQLFATYGLPGAIRSDNGVPFASPNGLLGLSRLSVWWLANGIDLERSRPGCPQDNGGHERLHRDIAAELEGVKYAERQAALETWRREFNEKRPHQALGLKVPQEIYTPSVRKWKGGVGALDYAGMMKRRVNRTGYISHGRHTTFISQALAGWDVGLRPCGDGRYEVYFAALLLGELESTTATFQANKTPPAPSQNN